jgi:HEAT repeat protein
MIEDPDADVRLAAAMAAGELKVERALRPLLALLEQENDSDVMAGVLRALGQLGDPGAVNAIEKRAVGSFFSRPPADVRIAAYRALHNIGTPHAKSLLMQAADDKDPAVKGAVRQLLGMR